MGDACLILFAKTPEVGRVKTRLCPPLSLEQATELYAAFLGDIAESVSALRLIDRVLAYAGEGAPLQVLLGESWIYQPQRGANLGERMANAVRWAWTEGYRRCIIIGSDSPGLPLDILREAFACLREHEVVLGPCMDGGYYLIGFGRVSETSHRWVPRIFEQIPWSTAEVFQQTLARLDSGCRLHLLPPWYDVDTIDELRFLKAHLEGMHLAGQPVPRRTFSLLISGSLSREIEMR